MERSLLEMSNKELWELFPIVLCSYNSVWSEWYMDERDNILRIIDASSVARINHIGSTSVPGLTSKPTVDILLEVCRCMDEGQFRESLGNIGYIHTPQNNHEHLVFVKGYTTSGFADRVFHLHILLAGDPDELYFRDYLRDNPETATRYANLKQELLKRFKHDRNGYTAAKGNFIRSVTERARIDYAGQYKIRGCAK